MFVESVLLYAKAQRYNNTVKQSSSAYLRIKDASSGARPINVPK